MTIIKREIVGGCFKVPAWTYSNGDESFQLKPDAIGGGRDNWIVTPVFLHSRPKDCTVCRHSFQSKKAAIRYIKSHLIPLGELVKTGF